MQAMRDGLSDISSTRWIQNAVEIFHTFRCEWALALYIFYIDQLPIFFLYNWHLYHRLFSRMRIYGMYHIQLFTFVLPFILSVREKFSRFFCPMTNHEMIQYEIYWVAISRISWMALFVCFVSVPKPPRKQLYLQCSFNQNMWDMTWSIKIECTHTYT